MVVDPATELAVGLLPVHVDDGAVSGDETNEVYMKALDDISKNFD